MQKIAHGAEAVLYRDDGGQDDGAIIIKKRLEKAYRLPQLDSSLRKFRTRREAKILRKLEELNFPAPRLREFSDSRMEIIMDFVPGIKVKDALESGMLQGDVPGEGLPGSEALQAPKAAGLDWRRLAREIGEKIRMLHSRDIIHGDLTTSNMLLHKGRVHFIDFGLSAFSEKIEDKAVDLHLLDRALESKHYQLYPDIFEEVLEGYRLGAGAGESGKRQAEEVLARMRKVQLRGRNKGK